MLSIGNGPWRSMTCHLQIQQQNTISLAHTRWCGVMANIGTINYLLLWIKSFDDFHQWRRHDTVTDKLHPHPILGCCGPKIHDMGLLMDPVLIMLDRLVLVFHEEFYLCRLNVEKWKYVFMLFEINSAWKVLTHCDLVMPYGIIKLGQHWFR